MAAAKAAANYAAEVATSADNASLRNIAPGARGVILLGHNAVAYGDFVLLAELSKSLSWDDNTAVDPAMLGPLWPKGCPPPMPEESDEAELSYEVRIAQQRERIRGALGPWVKHLRGSVGAAGDWLLKVTKLGGAIEILLKWISWERQPIHGCDE